LFCVGVFGSGGWFVCWVVVFGGCVWVGGVWGLVGGCVFRPHVSYSCTYFHKAGAGSSGKDCALPCMRGGPYWWSKNFGQLGRQLPRGLGLWWSRWLDFPSGFGGGGGGGGVARCVSRRVGGACVTGWGRGAVCVPGGGGWGAGRRWWGVACGLFCVAVPWPLTFCGFTWLTRWWFSMRPVAEAGLG